MKFEYEYRTRDNVLHGGIIVASDREDAFGRLKVQGIRPSRLREAPGLFNKLFGKGKRWLAIGVLGVACAVLCTLAMKSLCEKYAERYAAEDRAQVYGDPLIIQKLSHNGWRKTFQDPGEAWLARHAIPGKLCDCPDHGIVESQVFEREKIAESLMSRKDIPFAIEADDSYELKKMKRIVNGMKREFADYAETHEDALDYMYKSCERCRVERVVFDNIARDIALLEARLEKDEGDRAKILADWDKKNGTLRSMGLPTVPRPE